MIAPAAEADPAEQPLLALALASARAYPDFVAELERASGADAGYLECGALMVARDADEAEALWRAEAVRARLGLSVTRLTPREARRVEPALAPTLRGALELQSDGAIDPRRLTAALAVAFTGAGGVLRRDEVTAICASEHRVTGVALADGSELLAGLVLVAAGPWSGRLAGVPDDARIPIRPVKGQVLRLKDPSGPGLLTRVLRLQHAYVVPRGDGRYVLGASSEERGFDTAITVGPVFELLRDAIELLPGLSELEIEAVLAGTRPGTPDNRPAIGPGALDGLHWATGHYRHGILLAPVTAEIAVAALCDGEPHPLAAEVAPARFAGAVGVR
jgi:glycine oxidase